VAIKNRCVSCDFVIEAQDAMRGREVVCPKCETPNVLRSAEDAALMADEARTRADRERRRFLEGLTRSGSHTPPSSEAAPAWSPPDDAARGLAALAGRRLKDVSVYLLAIAYLVLVLAFATALTVVAGTELQPVWKAFAFLGGATAGVGAFVLLKFASDAVRALADVTDLLRSVDVRLEKLEEAKAPREVTPTAQGRAAAVSERSAG
jgi:hypothetical protein